MTKINYGTLSTEQHNPSTKNIDRLSLFHALRLINKEDAKIPKIVWQAHREIENAINLTTKSLSTGGKLFLLGAGTSGRFAVMEAAECPPTFNTHPALIQAYMAGGKSSVFRSKEGAEDQGSESKRIVSTKAKKNDVLIGIAASGVTNFVKEGLKEARKQKLKTILITCNPKVSPKMADVVISLNTGPEVITGSTRLKAGTATKLVLNMITVVTMTKLGKVYGNKMVDLQPRSKKLEARAIRLIQELGRVSEKKAISLLKESKRSTKTAIVMARKNINFRDALSLLKKSNGHLHLALGETN